MLTIIFIQLDIALFKKGKKGAKGTGAKRGGKKGKYGDSQMMGGEQYESMITPRDAQNMERVDEQQDAEQQEEEVANVQ